MPTTFNLDDASDWPKFSVGTDAVAREWYLFLLCCWLTDRGGFGGHVGLRNKCSEREKRKTPIRWGEILCLTRWGGAPRWGATARWRWASTWSCALQDGELQDGESLEELLLKSEASNPVLIKSKGGFRWAQIPIMPCIGGHIWSATWRRPAAKMNPTQLSRSLSHLDTRTCALYSRPRGPTLT